jgi:hypothetical protein
MQHRISNRKGHVSVESPGRPTVALTTGSLGFSRLRPGTSRGILDPLSNGNVDSGGATSGPVEVGHGKPPGKPAIVFDRPFDSLNWEALCISPGQARVCV